MNRILIDIETENDKRVISLAISEKDLVHFVEDYKKYPEIYKRIVQFVDEKTGETIKGPKYDTSQQETYKWNIEYLLNRKGVKQQKPIEPSQHEPRDRFQENSHMSEITKFKNIVRECISEIKQENDPMKRLKESLRIVVKKTLNEIYNVARPELSKEEKETIDKGYVKAGHEKMDKTNEKQESELESLVHGIDPTWEVYWDDHGQLIVRAQNLLYVRICPKFENNYDIDAMVRLENRVRAISLTWEQVKAFVKANFSDLKKTTNLDQLDKKYAVYQKSAGPDNHIIKNRGEKKNGEDYKIKSTKQRDMDYNEPQVKKAEDMPDQPMRRVAEPGKDPEGKNRNISKTEKPKASKFKNDKKLRVADKKTPKFVKKQVSV